MSESKAIRPLELHHNSAFNVNSACETLCQSNRKTPKGLASKNESASPLRVTLGGNRGQVECRDENESIQLSPISRMGFAETSSHGIESDGNTCDVSGISQSEQKDGQCGDSSVGNHMDSSFPEPDQNGELEINDSASVEEEETEEERTRREMDESEALARRLMAEEAMASYALSTEFLRDNADQYSREDLIALQAIMAEEDPHATDDEGDEERDGHDSEDMSYDALLRLGERIGDVKEERWALIADEKIENIPTLLFNPSMAEGKDENHTEVKCLICQFPYEEGEELRQLPCNHCFHKDCIDSWLQTKDTCAFCRKSIVP